MTYEDALVQLIMATRVRISHLKEVKSNPIQQMNYLEAIEVVERQHLESYKRDTGKDAWVRLRDKG